MKAIQAYQESVKILKKDYDARYNLALAYHLNGDYNLAGLTYCKAIELQPLNYEAHYNLAVLLNHLKYYKEALKEVHKASAIVSGEKSDTNESRYVFEVMSDITRQILKDDDGLKYLSDEFDKDANASYGGLTYINGKIVATEELDKAMYENLKKCSARYVFRDEDNLDEEIDELDKASND